MPRESRERGEGRGVEKSNVPIAPVAAPPKTTCECTGTGCWRGGGDSSVTVPSVCVCCTLVSMPVPHVCAPGRGISRVVSSFMLEALSRYSFAYMASFASRRNVYGSLGGGEDDTHNAMMISAYM